MAKKKIVPVVNIADEKLEQAINDLKKACRATERAKALREKAEEVILPVGLKEKRKLSREREELQSSIVLNDKVEVTGKNRYSSIDFKKKRALQAVFGDDYSKYFETDVTISLTKEVKEKPTKLRELIKLIGKDKFNEFLVIDKCIKVKDEFHNDLELNTDVEKRASDFIKEGSICPAKASCKLRK